MVLQQHVAVKINQIARNFAIQGEGAAVRATADHIMIYWAPLLRDTLAQCLLLYPERLSPIAREAATIIAQIEASGERQPGCGVISRSEHHPAGVSAR